MGQAGYQLLFGDCKAHCTVVSSTTASAAGACSCNLHGSCAGNGVAIAGMVSSQSPQWLSMSCPAAAIAESCAHAYHSRAAGFDTNSAVDEFICGLLHSQGLLQVSRKTIQGECQCHCLPPGGRFVRQLVAAVALQRTADFAACCSVALIEVAASLCGLVITHMYGFADGAHFKHKWLSQSSAVVPECWPSRWHLVSYCRLHFTDCRPPLARGRVRRDRRKVYRGWV